MPQKGNGKKQPAKKSTRKKVKLQQIKGNRGNRGSQEIRGTQGRSGVRFSTIASAYGTSVPGGAISFVKGRNSNCMRARFRQYVGEIGYTTLNATTFIVQNLTPSASNNGGQWYFNPTNSQYLSGLPFYLMSSFFEKFYLYGLSLDLYSMIGTSTNGVIACGSIDEPTFFESSGVATATTNPSTTLITQMYQGRTVPVWTPHINVPAKVDPKQMFFARGPDGAGTFYAYGDDAAVQRQCYSHVFGFRVSLPAAPASDTALFSVYINVDIELCDFASTFTGGPTFSLGRRLREMEKKLKVLEDDSKFNIIEPSEMPKVHVSDNIFRSKSPGSRFSSFGDK
jgi:hypothetical protein